MSHRALILITAGLSALALTACQPASDGKSDASTEGAMAPAADGAMAPAQEGMAPADKMEPQSGAMVPQSDGMASDKMAPQH